MIQICLHCTVYMNGNRNNENVKKREREKKGKKEEKIIMDEVVAKIASNK